MKRDQSQKQEQTVQTEQKEQVIRVRSSLRAGLADDAALKAPCC